MLPTFACPSPGDTPRPGHSAGGLMPEAARGKGVWPRPQAPHSPRPPGSTLPDGALGERDSLEYVLDTVTTVTSRLCYRDNPSSSVPGLARLRGRSPFGAAKTLSIRRRFPRALGLGRFDPPGQVVGKAWKRLFDGPASGANGLAFG